ncbi:S9 family peptidase [Sphingosinicella rhizophila]|nr:DPP IV N-terminal domain-containing protein [Sphingosinicella sp. GR2756]
MTPALPNVRPAGREDLLRLNWLCRLSILAASAMCLLSPVASAAEKPMRESLEAIDAIFAREESLVRDGRPDWLWVDGRTLLFRSDHKVLDIRLVTIGERPTDSFLTRDAWLRPALDRAVLGDRALTLHGLAADRKHLFLAAGQDVFAVDLATHGVGRDDARSLALGSDRAQLISDQFPTTFGPLMEAASPRGDMFAGVKDHNIYVRNRTGERRFLTDDGVAEHGWLDTEESAQGLNASWSPDGTRLAAVRLDSRHVAREPLVRWLDRAPRIDHAVYPRAGDPIHRFHLAVIDVRSGARVPIRTGTTDNHYVNLLGWSEDGKSIFYQVVDREQKALRIFRGDAASGEAREILRETSETYIDTPMTLSPQLFFPIGGGFLYLSERDGWRHIYRYTDGGTPLARLTRGRWAVENIVRVSDGWVYFRAALGTPYQAGLYRVRLRGGGKPEPVVQGGNVRDVAFSPDGATVLTVRSSPIMAPVVELHSAAGRSMAVLAEAKIDKSLPTVERVVSRSSDGRFDMHGLVVRPSGFDPARRYPVVEIIYGGMQVDFVPRDAYATGWWRNGYNGRFARILANQGYVVLYMSAPGTPGRGRAFQDATYGTWPQGVIAEHAKFIRDAAATRPWMDLGRVGVFGSSWGGYLAQRALIDAPDLYRAAVALAPSSDLVDHTTYIEPFMGLPSNNPAGYAAGSNLTRLNEIRGAILLMPEPLDANSGFSPAMKFLDGMIRVGGDVELFTMPDINHRINCCGWDHERYAYAIAQRFLDRKLIGDREQND